MVIRIGNFGPRNGGECGRATVDPRVNIALDCGTVVNPDRKHLKRC